MLGLTLSCWRVSFLLWMFFMKYTKFVKCLNVASCTDCFPFFQKVDQMQQFSVDYSVADQQCVFPSLKCSTHLLILLAPMQASPYTPQSHSQMTPVKFSFLKINSVTAHYQNNISQQPFSCGAWRERNWCRSTYSAFMLARKNATNGPIMLVTIFPPNSS